jgi:transcriptional regulator with XRE-family HTH domain
VFFIDFLRLYFKLTPRFCALVAHCPEKSAMSTQIFATRLTEARRLAGLTQRELAEGTLVSLRTVQGWESGEGPLPRPNALRRLSELLRVSSSHLLGVETPPAPAGSGFEGSVPEWEFRLAVRIATLDESRRTSVLRAFHAILDAVAAPAPAGPVPLAPERRSEVDGSRDNPAMEAARKLAPAALQKAKFAPVSAHAPGT